jgi:hypothetical protein
MKLNKSKVNYNQIFELHLIKNRIYEHPIKKTMSERLPEIHLSQTILDFKKALQVIFKYHGKNKKILFLGVPENNETDINLKTRHTAVSVLFDTKNFQNNNKNKNLLPKVLVKPDLIVLFNSEKDKYQAILKESQNKKTPLINFSPTGLENRLWGQCYTILTSNNNSIGKKNLNNIFFTVVNAMINKPGRKTPLKLLLKLHLKDDTDKEK